MVIVCVAFVTTHLLPGMLCWSVKASLYHHNICVRGLC